MTPEEATNLITIQPMTAETGHHLPRPAWIDHEMRVRPISNSEDRELYLRCRRCGMDESLRVTHAELRSAYPRSYIPKTPAPTTVIARIPRAGAMGARAFGHVCVPRGFHSRIDDSATARERFEAISVYFAELAIMEINAKTIDEIAAAQASFPEIAL